MSEEAFDRRGEYPLYSLLLPLLFLLLGGIGLPGGAVYVETWRLRNSRWVSAVSLAGPLSNLVLGLILAVILRSSPGESGWGGTYVVCGGIGGGGGGGGVTGPTGAAGATGSTGSAGGVDFFAGNVAGD